MVLDKIKDSSEASLLYRRTYRGLNEMLVHR